MKTNSAKPLLIGQLAKLAGVKSDTVRFYERTGLLARPTRTAAGYRSYDVAAARQLRFVKKAQALGFSLEEVRRILRLRHGGSETCRSVIAIAEATLAETESKLRDLEAFRDSLRRNLARWKRAPKKACALSDFCILIESATTTPSRSVRDVRRDGRHGR